MQKSGIVAVLWRSLALAVLCSLAACRIGFDLFGDSPGTDDAGTTLDADDAALPEAPLWVASIGVGPEETLAARVIEDAAGDVWLVGDTYQLGSRYVEGWVGKLDGETGAFELGGIRRSVSGQQTLIGGGILGSDGVFVVGSAYDGTGHQPTVGSLQLDGTWIDSFRLGGGLTNPEEDDEFNDIVLTNDGGMLLVGDTHVGEGGCSTNCLGTDALAVKMRGDGSVEWVRTVGEALGDETYVRAVALPDGGVIAFGGQGRYDYSGGAETAIDSAPSLVSRIGGDGMVHWSLRLSSDGGMRGGILYDGVYDPARNEVIVVGRSNHGRDAIVAQITPDGTVTAMHRVRVTGEFGSVTGVVLADDGGLFIAGYEYLSTQQSARTGYIARISPSLDTVVWARWFSLGKSRIVAVRLVRSRRGDLLAWANGTGPDAAQVTVWRVREDGEMATCFPTITSTLTIEPEGDATIPANVVVADVAAVIAEPVTPSGSDFEQPVPAMHCGP